jgi:hypothetical protein
LRLHSGLCYNRARGYNAASPRPKSVDATGAQDCPPVGALNRRVVFGMCIFRHSRWTGGLIAMASWCAASGRKPVPKHTKLRLMRFVNIALVIGLVAVFLYALFVAAMFLRYLAAGGTDYRIALGNGYELVRTSSEHIMMSAPDHTVILGPTVNSYRTSRYYVFGHVSSTESARVTAFFLVDTRNGKLQLWSTKKQWLRGLKKAGVVGPYDLKRPMRP